MTENTVNLQLPAGSRIAVAGGCGGIGRVLVASLLAQDCRVAVIDMPASIEQFPPSASVLTCTADATNSDEVAAAMAAIEAEWGALDGFVNLCGFTVPRRPVEDYPRDTWSDVIEGNLTAAWLLSAAVMPLLRKGESPSLVHMSSSLAVKASPGYAAYSAAKAGILSLTRMLAEENAPAVRVNAVAPNAVRTAFLAGGTGRPQDNEALLDLEAYGRALPLGRNAEPEDVVGPVLFLLGQGSAFMTGQVLHVNGGLWQP